MTHFSFAALNGFDYVIIAFIFISLITGLFRGFVHEAISLAVLILALVIGLKYAGLASGWLVGSIKSEALRYFLGFLAIFIGIIVLGAIINMLLHTLIVKIGLGFFDHILGIIFGVARGILLVAALLLFLKISPWSEAHWLRSSQLAPKFKPLVTWLESFLPKKMTNEHKRVGT